jgi:hypothetical protein
MQLLYRYTEYKKRTVAAGFFDDQTCLNRFVMENAGKRNSKVKAGLWAACTAVDLSWP